MYSSRQLPYGESIGRSRHDQYSQRVREGLGGRRRRRRERHGRRCERKKGGEKVCLCE